MTHISSKPWVQVCSWHRLLHWRVLFLCLASLWISLSLIKWTPAPASSAITPVLEVVFVNWTFWIWCFKCHICTASNLPLWHICFHRRCMTTTGRLSSSISSFVYKPISGSCFQLDIDIIKFLVISRILRSYPTSAGQISHTFRRVTIVQMIIAATQMKLKAQTSISLLMYLRRRKWQYLIRVCKVMSQLCHNMLRKWNECY